MNNVDRQYVELVKTILRTGTIESKDRTGVGTIGIFGHSMRFNLMEGFPLLTIKRGGFKNVLAELIWFIQRRYQDGRVCELEQIYSSAKKWWVDFEKEDGTIGPMYTRQLTNFNGQDLNQIKNVVISIKQNPSSRRHLLTTYNPIEAPLGALMVCHGLTTMFNVSDGYLNCATVQRSADTMLGIPANVASYSLLTHMIAYLCNLKVGELYYTFLDSHIYLNHLDGANEIIRRAESGEADNLILPTLQINRKVDCIDDFTMDDFTLLNYNPLPSIKLPIAV